MVVFARSVYFAVAVSAFTVCYSAELSDKCRDFSINITDLFLGKTNSVLPPFMVWNLFFTVAIAASGDTAEQVLSALGLSQENENALIKAIKVLNKKVAQSDLEGVHFINGNFMFLHNEFQIHPEFEAITSYGLELQNEVLNFNNLTATTATVNSFIESPNGKMKDVLKEEDFYKSRMILASSTFFEGTWALPFNALDTTIEPFYNEKGEIIRDIYMMNQRNKFPFTNIEELGAFVLQLPYGSNDKYCMLILLPSPDLTVSKVHHNLVHNFTIKDILYKLNNDTKDYGLDNIDIKIPRFEIKTNRGLEHLLRRKGIEDIFDLERANFNRATSESIFVSKIKQAVGVSVTESGTSASASASVIFTDEIVFSPLISGTSSYKPIKSDPVYSPGFIANKPFIYYIMELTTTTIIFGGAFSESIVF